MPIIKPIKADSGIAISYHKATRFDANLAGDVATVTVQSYTDEAAAQSRLPVAWNSFIQIDPRALVLDGGLLAAVEAALTSLADSPFKDGEVVSDKNDTLDTAQSRAWARVKVARNRAETGTCTYDGGVYDINVATVTGCVTAAMYAKQNGEAYTQDWTLADNSVRTLDADQVIAMGMAMMATIADIYKTGRELRAQIYAPNATIEAVEALAWPA